VELQVVPTDAGVAKGGSNTTLVVFDRDWKEDIWAKNSILVLEKVSRNIGVYYRRITGNTANKLTFDALPSGVEVEDGDQFQIRAASEPLRLYEFVHYLVGGDLTEDGIQWSDEVSTVGADTDTEVFKLTLNNTQTGKINRLTFGLTCALKAASATADVKYKWQARNYGASTWVDLLDYQTKADIGTSYVEYTVSGYLIAGVTNLDSYPIEIRLVVQSNESAADGGECTAKVKNSSFCLVELQ